MISREFLFRECDLKSHCIGLAFIPSSKFYNQNGPSLFMLKAAYKNEDFVTYTQNVSKEINTEGIMHILAFSLGGSVADATEYIIDTKELDHYERV